MAHVPPAPINWMLLAQTVEHFKQLGFTPINAPWIVPPRITHITAPPLNGDFSLPMGDLVGSAEQSFLHLMTEKRLPPGRYVTLTPCFREEETYDTLHQPYFMKVELIDTTCDATSEFVSLCRNWFSRHAGIHVQSVKTDEGVDIELGGVEIGSYGFRTHEDLFWTYGTALAEPRFSTAVALATQEVQKRGA